MIPFKDVDRAISFGSKQAKKRRAQRNDPGHDRLPPEANITLAAEREATGIDGILAAPTPGSPTPAASATTWTGPGYGRRSGCRPSRTGCGAGTT